MPPLPGCAPGSVEFAALDLSSLRSVKDFAQRFNRQGRQLDVLVCNAGIMSPPARLVSDDGLELQFQVGFRTGGGVVLTAIMSIAHMSHTPSETDGTPSII